MPELSNRLADLSPEKRALLEALLRKKREAAGGGIPRLERGSGPLPLSFAQERLWFLDRLEPGSAAYNLPVVLRFAGRLDPAALRASLSAVARRHEALRTRFEEGADGPVQVVEPAPPGVEVPLPLVDLGALPEEAARAEAERQVQAEVERPFDLRRGPLLRALLVRLAPEEHRAVATLHHIVGDGWSLGLFAREVGQGYAAFAAGGAPALPELPIQYADFAAWQKRRLLEEGELDRQLAYWRERLAGLPPSLDLPADRPNPPVRTGRGGVFPFELPERLGEGLRQLARERETTLFAVLLAAFGALLQRYSGQDDLPVGTPVAGRRRVETEGLIGFFVNTLVARIDAAGDPPFLALIDRVRERLLEADENQEAPFERLVAELAPDRDLGRTPLFQVLFVLQNAPSQALDLPGLRIEPVPVATGGAKFDLTLSLGESGDRLAGSLEFSLDRFDAPTARRLVEHFRTLLEGAVAGPEQRISELPLLDGAERHQIVREWNPGETSTLGEETLHGGFAAQAERTPEAVAVSAGPDHLTYGELLGRARKLAARLRSLGIGPESRVGLCAEPSLELIIGLVGILEAGGAYVPLDPRYPKDRLAYQIEDAGLAAIVGTAEALDALPDESPGAMPRAQSGRPFGPQEAGLFVFQGPKGRNDLAQGNALGGGALCSNAPDHLAYIIYTSGSTGRPKGVQVTHANAVRLFRATERWFGFGPADVWTLFHSFAFDFSVWEIWGALLYGGRLVIVQPLTGRSPKTFLELLEAEKVTVLNQTPSAFGQLRQLVEEGAGAVPSSLRYVLFGGEALDPASLAGWFRLAGDERPRLVNLYGITETTVHVTYRPLSAADARPGQGSAIGQPIPDLRLRVLDWQLQPVPIGVAGELCVGGAGLARGYLGRPELTAERWVPDAFGEEPGSRLYRSGDLGRYRPDGDVEYLGRIDHQVKIRGYRIELGEIESALGAHPDVAHAAVLAEGRGGDSRLIAYLVPRDGAVLAPDALRAFLRERLPDPMIPSAFLSLPELPLTSNEKVDRRRLAGLGTRLDSGETAGRRTPRTPTEETLAGLFAQVLGFDDTGRVGAEDSFFDLGGHSLLATRLISRVRDAFGIELPLRTLFEKSSVSLLAGAVDESLRGGKDAAAPPLQRRPRGEEPPLSFAQQRLWFLQQLDPDSSLYNIPVFLRAEGDLDPARLAAVFAEVTRRHEVLRTRFAARGGRPVQVIETFSEPALPVVDLAALPDASRDAEARRLAAAESRRPFHLEAGPPLRTALLRLGEREWLALVTFHHIASDGWSTGVLVREVSELYAASLAGRAPRLPGLAVQYADFAAWQREWLAGPVLDRELAHWRGRLAGAPSVLDLPLDRPRPPLPEAHGASRPLSLDRATAEALRGLVRREGATVFMALLAAFEVLLLRTAGQEDVSIGTPIAGRNRLETEPLIGFFVNSLVLRLDLSGDPSFRELLARSRAVTLDAYAHQDLPFEKLVEDLAPERSLAYTPLFQVMLTLQNAPVEAFELPGLRLAPVEAAEPPVDVDWSLTLTERDGGLMGVFQYRPDLFDATTIDRAVSHFRRGLREALAAPGRPVAELPWLDTAEGHQLLYEWSGAEIENPDSAERIQDLLRPWAERTPDALAVTGPQGSLTFAELYRKTVRLARHLRSLGVGPEARVALYLDRCPEMVVALLAVIEAGGAYVPLDPSYPSERLDYMVADSGARALVTLGRLAADAPALPPGTPGSAVVLLDRLDLSHFDAAAALPVPPHREPLPDHPAYVIYTSGSTGRPKGAVLPHRALVRYTHTLVRLLGLTPADRMLQFASLSFDVAVEEIFPTLAAGATVVLRDPGELATGEGLMRALREESITLIELPTAFWHEWVHDLARAGADRKALPPALRLVIIGGEIVLPERLAAWSALDIPLAHAYGLTEVTVTSTIFWVPAGERGDRGTPGLPIGRPIPGNRAHVVDRGGAPVPAGVPGELLLGGICLARGYLNRPELTATRFVPDPFSGEPGARLYRTGDLSRFLADGNIEFLGRIDHQVKVRGFRVELGEIEAFLARHPSVREVTVGAWKHGPGDSRLVAYVVFDWSTPGLLVELRRYLETSLPPYMVPSYFVELPALPRTATGKLDRRALPAPDATGGATRAGLSSEYVAPRTLVEEVLVAIWSEVLGVERVGVEDNFFELGGHSLLATQLASRVRDLLGAEMPLRALFEHPTVAGLAAALAVREPERKDGQDRKDGKDRQARTERRSAPLSFAQERLWFLHRLDPESAAYHIPLPMRVEGKLNPAVLARALDRVVARHGSLRTRFEEQTGVPLQVIDPPAPRALPLADLSGLPEEVREAEARRLARAEAVRPFDLERGPLARWELLRLRDPDQWAILFTLHHIVSDGWSGGILVQEVSAAYTALARGEEPDLPELPFQYADHAVEQRERLAGEALDAEVAWWRERLAGAPAVLDLPSDRPRPAVRTLGGASRRVRLSAELAGAARDLARRAGATPFMVVLAAFQALLARLSGQGDIVIGTPVAGRDRVETERLIGFFVNTLVLRADLSDEPPFLDLLRRARALTLEAYQHREVPFEKLVEALAPDRTLGSTPLFQVLLNWEDAAGRTLELPGLRFSPLDDSRNNETATAKLDLSLSLLDFGGAGGEVEGSLEYSTDLFDAPTVERLAGHWEGMLRAVLAEPERKVSEISFWTEAELHQLRREWNPGAPVSPGRTLPEAFREQVRRNPQAPAVRFGEKTLSYGELDAWSDQRAADLAARGIGLESRVGICAGRSFETIAALLGILKAGAAYVPLDPTHPPRRLAEMLEDSGAALVLAAPEAVGHFEDSKVPVLELELELASRGVPPPGAMPRAMSRRPFGPQEAGFDVLQGPKGRNDIAQGIALGGGALCPTSLAYVMFTSGSTGRPKGVEIPHAGIEALACRNGRATYDGADRMGHVANPAFDATTYEVWTALLNGACLVGIEPEALLSPAVLSARLAAEGITAILLTPALFHQVAGEVPAAFGGLRVLKAGGDALDPQRAREVLAAAPPGRFFNAYGPTEITCFATLQEIREVPEGALSVPIGRPIDPARAHVLDAGLRPVPIGVAGELCLGGAGLARGYAGRPDLTAERFVPDPLSETPGGRLYRTGDRARHRPDGALEFLGRVDRQIKLRGFRIELGEIEAALAEQPGVAAAAAVVIQSVRSEKGDRRLAAFVAGLGYGTELDPADLRRRLEKRLPPFMVPATIAVLPLLPVTPNGKVDRAALARLDIAGMSGMAGVTGTSARYVPPATPVEAVLADIWAEVLGLDPAGTPVGAEDNFFDLSGHSLLATQVQARVRDAFGVDLPLRRLFERATLRELALDIEAASATSGGAAAPAHREVTPVPRDQPLPASFYQEFAWHVQRSSPTHSISIPLTVRMLGRMDPGVLSRSLTEVVRRQEALRITFYEEGGQIFLRVAPPAEAPLPLIDLSGLPTFPIDFRPAEVDRLNREHAAHVFDLERGPLFVARLLRLWPEEHVLLFNVHHMIADGWSVRVLRKELGEIYQAFAKGEPSPLPDFPIQLADFAHWQRTVFVREGLAGQLAWWRRYLADLKPPLDMPADRPRPEDFQPAAHTRHRRLDAEVVRGLRQLARSTGSSLSMALLAGVKALLFRYTGRDDILIDTIFSSRNRAEIANLVGLFMNTVTVRADLSGGPGFRELLPRVRDSVLGAYAHQDVPFPRVLAEMFPGERLRRTLLSRLSFNLLTYPEEPETDPSAQTGFSLELIWADEGITRHDLQINSADEGETVLCSWTGAAELFDPESVEAFAEDYAALLADAVAEPDLPIGLLLVQPQHRPKYGPQPPVVDLARRLAHRTAGPDSATLLSSPVSDLERVPRDRDLPLSFAQSRLWFLHQLAPESAAYNLPVAVRLTGDLDVPALAATLSEVTARHEALRTTFAAGRDGEPVQRIAPASPWAPPRIDLAGLPAGRRDAEARRLVNGEMGKPFDLEKGPLLRALLLRLAEREHAVLFTMHHIVSDGWSVGVLVRELAALYPAFQAGRPSPLPPLPVQYADFAVWQRARLTGGLDAQLAYWRDTLAGAPPLLDLPFDRPHPPVASGRGGEIAIRFPAAASAALAALGRRLGATPFMTLLAGWAALLGRLSSETDVVVGTPIANRTRTELEGLIGFFVNTLVLRTDLSGAPGYETLVERVRERALGAFTHQDTPFEKLVEELAPERALGRTPLFQASFVFQNAPMGRLELPGLALETFETGEPTARFDLTLTVWEEGTGLAGAIDWNRDVFETATIGRLAGHLITLLSAAAEDPAKPFEELALLSEPERAQILREWNDTGFARPEAADLRLYDLFAAQAERTPEAVAVESETGVWTYGELRERSLGWRDRLVRRGAGPETIVALRMERSLERVAALLGVLAAGAAYVPLDPEAPQERLDFLLEDSGARMMIEERADGRVYLVAPRPETPAPALPRSAGEGVPENLAALLYTSGSTGRPKGVMLSHRGLVNRLLWAQRAYPLGPDDKVFQIASFSFDFAIWEHLAPLLAGARIVLACPGGQRDASYLVRTLAERSITIVHFVPSMMRVFLEEPGVERCASVRLVLSGGEALTPDLAALAMARFGAPLHNQYGPTETSIDSTDWPCHPGAVPPHAASVPIGRPIDNTWIRVLSKAFEAVPAGVVGELAIGGVGLARGYRGRPDLTAERFVPDPYGLDRAGERLYRTGDLARLRPDGALEVVGRTDHQVKIRGFRVEPEEIEAALLTLPGVSAAAVAVQGSGADRRLLACLVPEAGADPGSLDLAALRDELRRRLPDYLVPAAWTALGALPLLPSGKVDRRALARLQAEGPASAAAEPPRTPAEERIAAVWAEVLGTGPVGRSDDFFALGGHSLLATRVTARLRDAFGAEIPLALLFQEPTVAGFAAALESRLGLTWDREPDGPPPAPPLRPAGRDLPLPLSFAQQRLWFLDQLEPGGSAYNVPQALRLRGQLDRAALEASLAGVVDRHEALRTTFETASGGEPVQRLHPPAGRPMPIPLADLAELPEEARAAEARRLAREDAARPFDLARGPLLRATLVRLAPGEHVALFTVHHIVSDGWSTAVLVRELVAFYRAALAGRPALLPPLPVQYADFAAWQRAWLQGPALEAQLAFWRGRLAGAPPVLELPADRPRPAVASGRGGLRGGRLPARLTAPLAAFTRAAGATPFMVLLAAWKTLLARLTGAADLLVGTPIANRGRTELENLIGFFVNTVVLRTAVPAGLSFRAVAERVRDGALDAFEHQDLPFERLVEDLAPERSLAHSPIFQVLFVLHNNPPTELRLPGLTLESFEVEAESSKFDLTLFINEAGSQIGTQIEYASDLFDPTTADRWLGTFATLLENAVAAPDLAIGELPLLSEVERHQLRFEWNDEPSVKRPLAPVHVWFREQAARTPERIALIDGDRNLSYAEVDRRARALAGHLAGLGVGTDVPVGVYLARGWEMAVAMLAVMEAGGGHLPLDPAYPAERLAFMLADSGAPVVITQERLRPSLPAFAGQVVEIGGETPEPAAPAAIQNLSEAGETLSYVVYTSGSTGRPKGVAVPHRVLSNLIAWQLEDAVLPAATTLQFASPSFDASVHEVFATWAAGGTLVVATEEHRRNPESLLAHLRATRAERLFLPYVALQQLAETFVAEGGEPPALEEVQTAGEQLRITPEIARFFESLPGAVLHNHYGPSETHVVTSWTLSGEPRSWPALPPIGRPLAATAIHVVDRGFQPVPAGVSGELCVGGVMVARGYLGRPDATAERFLPDPWSAAPGGRLYRTGDLVRFRATGEIEFLGRIDDQVKIRGFRVEPGEIEAVLLSHPEVGEAVVGVRSAGAIRQLVAYIRPAAAGARELREPLRSFLKDRLPDYMVPSAFVTLESFPLTPSGKVDRRRLAQIAPENVIETGESDRAPRTPVEEILAGIWSELLGCGPVGIDRDFFELGGHSLLATRVISRVRSVFGVELPLRALFEHPTLAGFAAAVEAAREGFVSSAETAPPIRPLPRDGRPLPLSFGQARHWFLWHLNPQAPTYNMPFAIRLLGDLDRAAFTASLLAITRRHETLRTVYVADPDQPGLALQKIAPPESAPFAFPLIDLSGLADPEPEARRLAIEDSLRPFDLEVGPLARQSLLRLNDQIHVVLFCQHHSMSDGWSISVLIREVAEHYTAFVTGRAPRVPELPVQYADFANWQREWLSGEEFDRQVGYWKEQLAGIPPFVDLPTDRPRSNGPSYRGADLPYAAPPEVIEPVKALTRNAGATFFMTLLAAYGALLGRWAGQDDIVIGSPIAGRNRAETENLIGFFINGITLRVDLRGNPTVRELIGRTREVTLGSYAHQDIPFNLVVEAMQPDRGLAVRPLFNVLLGLQNTPESWLTLPGLKLRTEDLPGQTAKYELSLVVSEANGGLQGAWELDVGLLDRSTVQRMGDHLTRLLQAMAADPERPIADLPLLPAAEEHQLRLEWNDTAGALPRDLAGLGLHEIVAEQARRTPEAPALSFAGHEISYGELHRRSVRIAAVLRGLGVGPETAVAVCSGRSAQLIQAIVGILEAGGVYVPLDPSHPQERLAWLVQDSGAVAVLAEERKDPKDFKDLRDGVRLIGLENLIDQVLGEAGAADLPAPAWPGPSALACLIYTSGSTGRPKGAGVTHGSIVRMACDSGFLAAGPGDRVGHVANPAFDASTFEIWTALLRGACLVGIEKEALLSPPALAERLASERITVLLLTAALFHQGAREVPGAFGGLRYLLVGGESADPRAVREILSNAPPETFLHAYGPTEATVYVTLHAAGEDSARRPALPIGRPIRNVQVHVLDESLRPAPVGVIGDLYAGGDSLARGYHGRPDLTAERFVPDPFSGVPGARLYRTGDRARHLAGGELEFHGRRDGQVKIRGFRIELGEVEAALAELPGVAEAVVLVHDDPAAGRRLVAFAVERGVPLSPAALRAALERKLPSHLVPASCRVLPALPLTPNGKVDCAALQRLAAADPGTDGNLFVAPRTPVEEILAGIWAEVLGLDPARRRVGAFDNFFELSGHSLLATQVAFRIHEAFGVDLPLERLFDRATLADLAAEIEARIASERGGQAVRSLPLQAAPRDRPIRASFYQEWMYQYQKTSTESIGIPFAVRLRGELSLPVLGRSLAEVLRRHEVLRTVFREEDGKVFQVVTDRTEIPLPLVDVTGLPPERRQPELRRIGVEDNNLLFDLASGPMVRVRVFRLAADEHVTLFNIHHIVTDGWSIQLFQRELRVLYGAYSQGLPSPLPEPTLQFADFSWWQREVFEKEAMPAELEWWHRHLAGRPPVLELPADRPRPEEPSANAVAESLLIGPDLTAALRTTARASGCSLSMALIAGLEILLHRYGGGREDLLLDSIFAARHRPELNGMMGFLMNTATLRTDLSGNPTFRELLVRVRGAVLAAYAHQDTPFPRILESLFPGQKLYRTLLSRVAFNLISFSEIRDPSGTESITLPLETEIIGLADHVAKRDLLFTCLEAEDAVYCDVTGSSDLFDPESVVAIAKDYETILKAAAADPDVRIGNLLPVPSYHRAAACEGAESYTGAQA